MAEQKGWIGVDLDGTLAKYDGWTTEQNIGDPVPAMLVRVKGWLAEGKEVRIFTARVSGMNGPDMARHALAVRAAYYIDNWILKHVGTPLLITCTKDFGMVELWDDRAVQISPNTGLRSVDVWRMRAEKAERIIEGYNTRGFADADAVMEKYLDLDLRNGELQQEVSKLRILSAAAYQMAGAHNAPEEWLDALSEAADGRPFETEKLLPYVPEDARKHFWINEAKPIINAIGEISVQEAMDAIEGML